MRDFKQCNKCATDCVHKGAIRLCVCGKHTKPKQTNGDRIRDMTDEQLAKFLSDFAYDSSKPSITEVIEYLKQEVTT